jgi:predicted dehydrogenase
VEWEEFLDAVREQREPIGNGTDGVEALRLVKAVYRASLAGTTIKVADLL